MSARCQPYAGSYPLWGYERNGSCPVLNAEMRCCKIKAVMAAGFHLFPFRTEKLSPPAPMVLRKWESRRPPTFQGSLRRSVSNSFFPFFFPLLFFIFFLFSPPTPPQPKPGGEWGKVFWFFLTQTIITPPFPPPPPREEGEKPTSVPSQNVFLLIQAKIAGRKRKGDGGGREETEVCVCFGRGLLSRCPLFPPGVGGGV